MKKIRVLSAFCLISLALAGCSTTYYSVKFVLDDGTVLEVKEVKNGDKATYSGETPTKEAEEGRYIHLKVGLIMIPYIKVKICL